MLPRSSARPLLLKDREVAALLGVSRRHVATLRASGRMPAPVRLGCSVRWQRDEIEGWIAAGCPARERWEEMRERKGGRP